MNNRFTDPLPQPDITAVKISQELQALIQKVIEDKGGQVDFAEYMEMTLYTPGLGYYSTGTHKFGRQGDFITAPELSPLFAKAFANVLAGVLNATEKKAILEIGAGSGIFAADLLLALKEKKALPEAYYILERSADLKERQHRLLKQRLPEYLHRVHWIENYLDEFSGVIIANEVLDAIPVQRFGIFPEGIKKSAITTQQGELQSTWIEPDTHTLQAVQAIQAEYLSGISHYESEINLIIPCWLESLAKNLKQGLIIFVDYGFPRHEYYHPQRGQGTLMCHYQQRAHSDFLKWPGLQDITAHVDFTLVAESAVAVGLDVLAYTTQAAFLLESGLLECLEADNLNHKQHVKLLTSPQEMGEMFKVMVLGKNYLGTVPGTQLADRRHLLG